MRAECDAALAKLATVDPDLLPPDVRREYDEQCERWRELRALAEDDAMALHEAACLEAGRELSLAAVRALLKRQ